MPRQKTDSQRINIYVPNKVLKVYKALAKRRSATYSELMRSALHEFAARELKKEKQDG